MWEDIKRFIRLLLNNDYTMVIRDDDVDIIVIEYEHNELAETWGCPNPHWFTEEEAYSIEQLNESDSKENEDSELPF
jgi:RimJ/RimL family protein N-acetyltransferase